MSSWSEKRLTDGRMVYIIEATRFFIDSLLDLIVGSRKEFIVSSTLSKKMILSFAIITIGTMTIMGTVTYDKAKTIVYNQLSDQNNKTVWAVNEYFLDSFMADMEYVVTKWANDPRIISYRNPAGQPRMVNSYPENFKPIYDGWKGYVEGNPDIGWMYFGIEQDGSAFFAPLDPTIPENYDARLRPWYIGAVANPGELFWTNPYQDAGASGEMLVTVSTLVRDGDYTIGVIGLDVKLSKFSDMMAGLSIDSGGYLMIIGENGDVYAHPSQSMLMENLSGKEWIQNIHLKESGNITFKENGQEFIGSFITVEQTGWKLIYVNPIGMAEVFGQVKSWIALAVLLVIVGLVALSSAVTFIILKPLRQMMKTIEDVIAGNYQARMEITTKDELGRLGETFNRMLSNTQSLMEERSRHIEELTQKNDEIMESYRNTAKALGNAIEANDHYIRGHCDRVCYYAIKMGEMLNLNQENLENLAFASMLHDIGKLGISEKILKKTSSLTPEEFDIIKNHPRIGYDILSGIPFLEECRIILLQHHESVNGSGYPDGRKGEDIHYSAKILCIADAYDAMTSSRPYRLEPMSKEEALAELAASRGSQFDESLTDVFIKMIQEEEID